MADNLINDGDRKKAIVSDTIQTLMDLTADRAPLNAQCEEVAALILPAHVGSFFSPGMMRPYLKKTDQQIDSNGMVALERWTAILDSMLSPQNQQWHGLQAGGPHRTALMKDRATKMYFFELSQLLFSYRYAPISGFVGQNQSTWTGLGAFGNGALFIDDYYDVTRKLEAIRYLSVPFGSIYLTFNHQGVADGFIRLMRMKARVAAKVPAWKGKLDQKIMDAADKNPNMEFMFLHRVCPRDEYKPWMIDSLNMPWASYYICMDTKTFLTEGGYTTFPLPNSQYYVAPGEENGRSPAMNVLPALKTLNAEKRDFLIQGHRAGAPVLLMGDDGVMNMNMKPGAQNRGMINTDGKPMVQVLPHGDIQITEEMMQQEINLIESEFLVELFKIAEERKSGTTATEVIDEINKRGILIAPHLGRQTHYQSMIIDREISILKKNNRLPKMPPLLAQAEGEYSVVFQSPLAKAMRAGDVSGYFRTVEMAKEVSNVTGDTSIMDRFDFDASLPDIAAINGSPEPWMADDKKVAAKAAARAKQAQMENSIKAAPGAAGLISANAKAAQAGVAPAARDLSGGAAPQPQ